MNPRIIYTALCLLLSIPAFSQSCSFEENTVDKFTGKKHRLTEKMTIAENVKGDAYLKISEFYFIMKQEGDAYALKLGWKTKKSYIMMTIGDELVLLLSNQEKITLPITWDGVTPSIANNGGFKVDYSYWFNISADQLQKIKTYRITDVRVAAKINPVDLTIDEKAGAQVMTSAGCILSE